MNVFCRDMIAYREGVSDRLWSRLTQLRRDRVEADRKKKAEDEARARQSGGSGGTALILADVIQSEDDLNNDFLQGWEPGTTARRRAEDEAAWKSRVATAQAARLKAEQEREAAERANPALRDARLAREAAELEAERKATEKRRKQEERNEKRRANSGPRYRAQTAREKRADLGTYYEGLRQGDRVSLNKQVDQKHQEQLS